MSIFLEADGSLAKWIPAVAAPVGKFLVGLGGAVVSLKFMKDQTPFEKCLMVLGGALMSYLGAPFISSLIGWKEAEGLVGFLLGLFGMAIAVQVYKAIDALDGKQMGLDLWEWVKGLLPGRKQ